MTDRLAFIGLGVMGFPMAGHLADAGFAVSVFNRTTAKTVRWTERFAGEAADSPAAAADGATAVFCCVGNDDDVRDVVTGPRGVLQSIPAGAVLVDHTTVSADLARELAATCRARDVAFIDAPVSGGEAGAVDGRLTVMAGGDAPAFERVAPYIDCYSGYARLLGPPGSGQMAKMVNQICIAGLVQALSEGLNFAMRAGLDTAAVIDVISRGAAQSWQMNNRSGTMSAGEFDFGFAIDWMRKDLGIALREAQRNGARLPVTCLVDTFYAELQARGAGRQDTSALIALLADRGDSRLS